MSSSPLQTRTTPIPPNPRRDTPSPRSSSTSLAAAATINAADLSRRSSASNRGGSPRLGRAAERRRSQVAMNINLNDPSIPSPGELSSSDPRASLGHSFSSASPSSIGGTRTIADGDPHHHQRTPSLGEIHQELEQEQEAQVNRMLQMIREQQLRLDQMRMQAAAAAGVGDTSRQSSQPGSAVPVTLSTAVEDLTPASEQSFTLTTTTTQPQPQPHHPAPRLPPSATHRSSSRSPALRAIDHDSLLETATVRRNSNSLRDESAYYQAETASLTRENQMLRQRIRELERQVAELNSTLPASPPSGTTSQHVGLRSSSTERRWERQSSVPAVPSPLMRAATDGGDEK